MQNDIGSVVERHVVIDIETLGTDSNSFITSVSAVEYLHSHSDNARKVEIQQTRNYVLDPWAEQPGAVVDGVTVQWRQQQSEDTKHDLRLPPERYVPLDRMLRELRDFVGDAQVWANAPDFDLVILNNAAKRLGLKPITRYYKHRCVRTAKMALESIYGHLVDLNNPHTPLEDCINQLEYVIRPYLGVLDEYRTTRSRASEGGSGGYESASN